MNRVAQRTQEAQDGLSRTNQLAMGALLALTSVVSMDGSSPVVSGQEPVPLSEAAAETAAAPPLLSELPYDWYSGAPEERAVAVPDRNTGELVIKAGSGLPNDYLEGFEAAVDNLVVGRAFETGAIARLQLMTAANPTQPGYPEHAENGHFFRGDGVPYATLEIDDEAGGDTLYANEAVLETVAVHEAWHGINDAWYRQIGNESLGLTDPRLEALTQRVLTTCSVVRDDIYADVQQQLGDDVALAYDEAAINFRAEAARMSQDATPDNDAEAHSFTVIGDIFARTATALRYDEARIRLGLAGNHCQGVDIYSLANATPDTAYDVVADLPDVMYDHPDLFGSLRDVNTAIAAINSSRFTCINDGDALEAAGGYGDYIPDAHPEDDTSEAGSSLFVSVAAAPEYVAECLRQLPAAWQEDMNDYFGAIRDAAAYVDHEAVSILYRDANTAAVLDSFGPTN